MDTKLKSSKKWVGNLVCILLVLCTAVGTVVSYGPLGNRAMTIRYDMEAQSDQEEYEQNMLSIYVNLAYTGGCGFYWDIQQKVQNKALEPFELFYPAYYQGEESENRAYSEQFNERFRNWNNRYQNGMLSVYRVKYQVVDLVSGEFMTNASEDLSGEQPEDYPFYMKYTFDEKGNFMLEELRNKEGIEKENLKYLDLNKSQILERMEVSLASPLSMRMPRNITVYLMSENEDCYYMGGSPNYIDNLYDYNIGWYMQCAGLNELVLMFGIILAVAALLLPCAKGLGIGRGFFGKMPLEIECFLICIPFYSLPVMNEIAASLIFSNSESYLFRDVSSLMPYLIHIGLWAGIYVIWFTAVLSARALFTLGLKRYLLERIWSVRLIGWIWRKCSRTARWFGRKVKGFLRMCIVTLDDIDLTAPSDRMICKILGLNFIIVFLCCVLWYFGVAALILYTVILFFILKKYMRDVKEKYGILLRSTRRMAQGDLQAEITEDTGIFEPLKVELNKVQTGFRKAVEEEMKSQSMKTELITNVSHDLRTPLTAIITYVNLLKNEGISEEERREYVNILDRKSLRLKQLIEDLFEVSKAASGNIKVEKKNLNLTELVKQAAFEMEDRLTEAEIECRIGVPEKDVFFVLDGEKTYRCLENLLINVTKYAMPRTRAYLNLYNQEDSVEIVLKNVSAEELSMDVEELTERFIRGDKSRNKEGSGLGLAIVKSFVELQGGEFHVEADGDLFKARIKFSKRHSEINSQKKDELQGNI